MSSVDNRIVKMGFDNGQFESGIKTSLGTLDKLKAALKLDGSGLDSIRNAASKIDMRGLAAGVGEVVNQFGLLDMMGVQTLYKLGDAVTNAGLNFAKSVTIDPIMSGFSEYETKMNSITTILTNTAKAGVTLDDVTVALDDLNEYADLTIYNFAHMTDAVGKFTAAGVDLDTSVSAIKGFANLAAGSGVGAVKMSGAMVQLSQALSSGVMRLQDWNSMEQAGMGTTVFKEALLDKAEAMGVYVDRSINFRETLEQKWLTSDIITATLDDFANDEAFRKAAQDVKTVTQLVSVMQESVQSGWSQSWEYIIGNKDQATEFLTGISEGFNSLMNPIADARNEMLKFWNLNGGRAAVIQGLTNIFGNFANILRAVAAGFTKIFPPDTGERLVAFSEKFAKFTEHFVLSEGALKGISNVVAGIMTVIKPFVTIGKYFLDFFFQLLAIVVPVTNPLLSLVGVFGAITTKVGEFIDKIGLLERIKGILDKVLSGVQLLTTDASAFLDELINKIYAIDYSKAIEYYNMVKAQIDELAVIVDGYLDIAYSFAKEQYGNLTEYLSTVDWASLKDYVVEYVKQVDLMGKAKEIMTAATDKLKEIWGAYTGVLDNLKAKFKSVFDTIAAIYDRFVGDTNMRDILNSGLLGALTVFVVGFIKQFGEVTKSFSKFMNSATEVLDATRESLEQYQKNLKSKTLLNIAIAVGVLAASLWLLSTIDIAKLGPALGTMVVLLMALVKTMKSLEELSQSGGSFKGLGGLAMTMIAMGVAIGLLAGALKRIAGIDPIQLGIATAAITLLVGVMVTSAKHLSSIQNDITVSAGTLIGLAAAITILSVALKIMASIPWDGLAKGLIGFGVLLGGLLVFMNLLKETNFGPKEALGITMLAGAMNIMAAALALIGLIPFNNLVKGLIGVAGSLTAMTIALQQIPVDAVPKAAGLLILSHALMFFATVLGVYALLPWSVIINGLSKIAVVLIPLIIAVKMMAGVATTAGAASMLMVSVGLIAMARALKKFENISLGAVVKGLIGLAGTLAILGVAATVLAPVIPIMGALAGILASIGVGVALFGAGIVMLGSGFSMLAVSGAAGALAIGGVAVAIAAAIPIMAVGLANGLVAFKLTLYSQLPALIEAIVGIGEALLSGLRALAKPFAETLVTLAQELYPAMQKVMPLVLAWLEELIIGLLNSAIKILEEFIPRFAESMSKILLKLLDTWVEYTPQILDKVKELLTAILTRVRDDLPALATLFADAIIAILTNFGENVVKFINAGVDLVLGIISGLESQIPKFRETCISFVRTFLEELANAAVGLVDAALNMILTLINGLADAIDKNAPLIRAAVWKLIKSIWNAIDGFRGDIVDMGKNMISGFIQGVKEKAGSLVSSIGDAVGNAIDWGKKILKINSPSKVFEEMGMYTMLGGAIGIDKNAHYLIDSVGDAASGMIDEMAYVMGTIAEVLASDLDANPVITPVLDLTNIQNGTGTLNGLLASGNYGVSTAINARTGVLPSDGESAATMSGGNTVYNTFHITGSNSEDIANQVSRVIQRDIERRNAVWE